VYYFLIVWGKNYIFLPLFYNLNLSFNTSVPEYILEVGDIVFGRKGAVDRSALVKPEQSGWFLGFDAEVLNLNTKLHTLGNKSFWQ